MTSTKRYRYARLGSMTYAVQLRETRTPLGELWRTRDGWRWRTLSGTRGESVAVSRDVAAAALHRALHSR